MFVFFSTQQACLEYVWGIFKPKVGTLSKTNFFNFPVGMTEIDYCTSYDNDEEPVNRNGPRLSIQFPSETFLEPKCLEPRWMENETKKKGQKC